MNPLFVSSSAPEAANEKAALASYINRNGGPPDPKYSRVSKISVDSFESSSTSSGECYQNVNTNYTNVDPGAGQEFFFFTL